MESGHQTPSVMAKLMGLDKEPSHHPVREKQRVLSEKYLQKVASIGFRKKRSSHLDNSLRTSVKEKEESGELSKVVKTIQKDENYNLPTVNGKENSDSLETKNVGLGQQLFNSGTLIEPISVFNVEASVKSGRVAEQRNLQLLQKINSGQKKDVLEEARLFEMFRQFDLKDETFPSRIIVLKSNVRKGESSLKCFSLRSSSENYHLGNGLLKDFSSPISERLYRGMSERKKLAHHMESVKWSPRAFSKVAEEVSSQTGDAANRVLDMVSGSLFRGNETCGISSEMLDPASNISVNENQCSSSFFCSAGSYVACQGKNKILEQRDVNKKLQEVGQYGQGTTIHQLHSICDHIYGARNLVYQSGCSNAKVNLSIRSNASLQDSSAIKAPMARPLHDASVCNNEPRTRTKNDILHKHWGLRQDAFLNWSPQESKKQNTNKKDCSANTTLKSSSEKSNSPISCSFNSNHNEENHLSLHKPKKKFSVNDLSDQKPILPELSTSWPSPALRDGQIIQQTFLMKDEVKNNKIEDSNMAKKNIASPNSPVDDLVANEKTEVICRPCGNPKNQQLGESDSFSHTSYASIQQETSEFHEEESVYSLCSETQPDSLGSFEEPYEPSPISVLEPPFRENFSSSSEWSKVLTDNVCDSSEMDNEGLGLNVSSDEDCGDKSVGDFEEKQYFVGFLRAAESRDFSYVVEVLTEAGISNRSLYTDFCTWHSPQCPISPFVFEILEMKFGKQPSWKRSDRRFLFDRINLGLLEILQPCMGIPTWERPVTRRLNAEPNQDMIEEELWELLVVQKKEAKKESADRMLVGEISWTELGSDIEVIVREIVMFLIEELAEEIVRLESF